MQQDESARTETSGGPSEEKGRCLYPNKRCENPRGTKSNGQLHNFCQYHRDKANYNQRQLQFKRSLEQEQGQSGTPAQAIPIRTTGPHLLPKLPLPQVNAQVSDEEFELDEECIRLIEEVASADCSSLDNQA
ncbi:hypothetical protein PHYPSEUDO_007110 [Phytophthora pseudosyringae]|uniref:Uncharacterized protein n=1 Tax=Phytophthora pseudosyringae TaxID=221518 RepID=A0A8T1WDB3_9STRA|nr:hypothetical protein PHYPSEUDO_007110 [Phytophthora pseudosyringae]